MVRSIFRSKRWYILAIAAMLAACSSHRYAVRTYVPANATEDVQNTLQQQATDAAVVTAPVADSRSLTWQDCLRQRLDSVCRRPALETTQMGLMVYDLTDNTPLYAYNARQRMRPASNQKVVTAITALHYLGGMHSLSTDMYADGEISGGTLRGNLYIVGHMDPMLSEADLARMASILKKEGIAKVTGKVIADVSMKDDKQYGWGWCWDDDYGPLSALMVGAKDCFQQKWKDALRRAGISTGGYTLSSQGLPGNARLIGSVGHTLNEVLQAMMKDSNNIYAECVFYQTAASTGKKRAGRKEAAQRTADLITALGLDAGQFQTADGSGLSLYNYVSPELLVGLLNYAHGNDSISQYLVPSLPVAGVDGTLSKRMLGTTAMGNVQAKTGTVDGISSLSGYATAFNGHRLSFSIINQGVPFSRIGREIQDEVCLALTSDYGWALTR